MKRFAVLAVAAMSAGCSVETLDTASELREPRVFAERTRQGPPLFKIAAGDDGKVIVTLPKPDEEGVSLRVIHASGLTAGLGSNPVGLDRGYGDGGRIIAFRRAGDKAHHRAGELDLSRERRKRRRKGVGEEILRAVVSLGGRDR